MEVTILICSDHLRQSFNSVWSSMLSSTNFTRLSLHRGVPKWEEVQGQVWHGAAVQMVQTLSVGHAQWLDTSCFLLSERSGGPYSSQLSTTVCCDLFLSQHQRGNCSKNLRENRKSVVMGGVIFTYQIAEIVGNMVSWVTSVKSFSHLKQLAKKNLSENVNLPKLTWSDRDVEFWIT